MAEAPVHLARSASPASTKHVAFDHKCQLIPEGDCNDLRKLLSLCPTRAQSPPILASSTRPGSLIARTISPPFVRSRSPSSKKASGLGQAPPGSSSSWKTRLTSWGSVDANTIAGSLSAAFGAPVNSGHGGPRLVAPVPARGSASPIIPLQDDGHVEASPSREQEIDFDDVDAEFRQAVSGVAMQQQHVRVERVDDSPSLLDQQRAPSPFIRSITNLQQQQSLLHRRTPPKSCLVRSRTPQAPRPPPLMDDGMKPLRTTRSNDRESCFQRRRRAEGIPVICPSPLSSPDDERHPWTVNLDATVDNGLANQKSAKTIEKSKASRWRRFRRAASEESSRPEPSSSIYASAEPRIDEVAIKREIQAGRWPFEAPLNAECSCKNCQERIEVGLASNYEPKWTRAARIRWLEAQEDAVAGASGTNGSKVGAAGTSKLPRSASRTAIQADEVAQLHNETVHPMTEAELAAEPTSPAVEQGESGLTFSSEVSGVVVKPPNPTGLEEGDETLRREIIARRQRMARQSPVLRHGARSMMRQLEEAERIEQEAARSRSQSREGYRGTGSGRSSPASPAMSPSLPSTPNSVSTTPQERPPAEGHAASAQSYFDLPAPPERVRSPLIPAGVVPGPRYARPVAIPSTAFDMGNVALSLEAAVAESPSESPAQEEGLDEGVMAGPKGAAPGA